MAFDVMLIVEPGASDENPILNLSSDSSHMNTAFVPVAPLLIYNPASLLFCCVWSSKLLSSIMLSSTDKLTISTCVTSPVTVKFPVTARSPPIVSVSPPWPIVCGLSNVASTLASVKYLFVEPSDKSSVVEDANPCVDIIPVLES